MNKNNVEKEPLVINYIINKQQEGTYFTIDFPVPSNIESVQISYKYPRSSKVKNVVDLGLMDEKGQFLGWSGSAHPEIHVGEFSSSNGYLTTPVTAGTWKILVGAYKVAEKEVAVTFTIHFKVKKPRFLYGDLHVHSTASDGTLDIPALGQLARKKSLDFLAVANHNNYAENLALPKIPGLTYLPAVEWTHYDAHVNFYGVASPFENSFIANGPEEMKSLLIHAKNVGALVSINHPLEPYCPFLWETDATFDMMEIWNGPMRSFNAKAIALWTSLLKKGRRIPAVGGSDFHSPLQPARLGHPTTGVLSLSPDSKEILKALSQGHSFITHSPSGPRIGIKYGAAIMGDQVPFCPKDNLLISASNVSGCKLVVVTKEGEYPLPMRKHSPSNKKVTTSFKITKPGFVYVKAVLKLVSYEHICAITNPIYII